MAPYIICDTHGGIVGYEGCAHLIRDHPAVCVYQDMQEAGEVVLRWLYRLCSSCAETHGFTDGQVTVGDFEFDGAYPIESLMTWVYCPECLPPAAPCGPARE